MTTNTKGEIHLKCGAFEKRFTLTWDQKGTVMKKDKYLLVAGPPGTGKTTVLMCKGLQWLKEGKDVLVCSLHRASIPTCCYLHNVLTEARKTHDSARGPEEPEWGKVKYHDYVLSDAAAVQSALDHVQGFKSASRPLCFLFDYMAPETLSLCQLALEFIKELKERLPDSEIWTSDWYSTVPEGFHEEWINVPLRFTQQVFPHINVTVEALELNGKLPTVYTYFKHRLDRASGPEILHLRHKGKGSDDKWPIDSEKCGRRVAEILRHLGVGSTAGEEATGASKGDHYQYRDVLIITRNQVKRGETPAFARGLEAAGIPTAVFGRGDYLTVEEALSDVILAPEDKVMVMNNEACIGLDRKVVVCLTGVGKDETWEVTEEQDRQIQANEFPAGTITMGDATLTLTLDMNEEQKKTFREKLQHAHRSEMELLHRLTIWSRCCRQLIVVHLPEAIEGPTEFKIYKPSRKCVIL